MYRDEYKRKIDEFRIANDFAEREWIIMKSIQQK
jgi:hypothetical protein